MALHGALIGKIQFLSSNILQPKAKKILWKLTKDFTIQAAEGWQEEKVKLQSFIFTKRMGRP